jgi:hypothetical protein
MRKTKLAALVSALVVSLACATSASAGFVNEAATDVKAAPPAAAAPVVSAKPLPESLPAATGRTVTQIGLRPASVSVPRGKGIDIALADVLPVIVPRDFRLDMGSINQQQAISWTGGSPWDTVLTNALTHVNGIEATINWDQKVVSMRNVGQGVVAANDIAPSRPIGPHAVAMRWQVTTSDVTLRQALMRWAKDAGWQVSWEISYDYPVQLEGSFNGTFEDAVDQFMGSLRYSDYPALACMYEANHVVRVLHYGDKKSCDK